MVLLGRGYSFVMVLLGLGAGAAMVLVMLGYSFDGRGGMVLLWFCCGFDCFKCLWTGAAELYYPSPGFSFKGPFVGGSFCEIQKPSGLIAFV